MVVFGVIIAGIVWLGLYPQPVLKTTTRPVRVSPDLDDLCRRHAAGREYSCGALLMTVDDILRLLPLIVLRRRRWSPC
jgi:hypothetical protein